MPLNMCIIIQIFVVWRHLTHKSGGSEVIGCWMMLVSISRFLSSLAPSSNFLQHRSSYFLAVHLLWNCGTQPPGEHAGVEQVQGLCGKER